MKQRKVTLELLVGCASLALSGCGGGGGGGSPAPAAVASVSIAPDSLTDWWGYDVTLAATARDSANTTLSPTPTLNWTSSAPSVASVSSSGVVSLWQQGRATIAATTQSGVTGSSTVTVRGLVGLGPTNDETMCATSDDRLQIMCWGRSWATGQSLIPNARGLFEYDQPTPIRMGAIPNGTRIRQVTTGTFHACALDDAGAAYCWGEGKDGKLGTGDASDRPDPTPVVVGARPLNVTYTSIWASAFNTCAAASNGRIYCWGRSSDLPASLPANSAQPSPVEGLTGQVPSGVGIAQVTVFVNGGCALGDDGRAYCWRTSAPTPVLVPQGAVPPNVKLTQLSGDSDFFCARADNGRIYCWGTANGRRFGAGDDVFRSNSTPVEVARGAVPASVQLVAVAVSGVAASNCALGSDGNAYCWGTNYLGSAGDGTTPTAPGVAVTAPQRVIDGERPVGVRYVGIECGRFHCTALGDDGRSYGWGSNEAKVLSRTTQSGFSSGQPLLSNRPSRD